MALAWFKKMGRWCPIKLSSGLPQWCGKAAQITDKHCGDRVGAVSWKIMHLPSPSSIAWCPWSPRIVHARLEPSREIVKWKKYCFKRLWDHWMICDLHILDVEFRRPAWSAARSPSGFCWSSPWHETVHVWNVRVQQIPEYPHHTSSWQTALCHHWEVTGYIANPLPNRWAKRAPCGKGGQETKHRSGHVRPARSIGEPFSGAGAKGIYST